MAGRSSDWNEDLAADLRNAGFATARGVKRVGPA
jgi:hypothetical protein